MSDSDESGVTHTEIPSSFEDLSNIGSPGVAPPSPDYIPGPEEPQSPPIYGFVLDGYIPSYAQEERWFSAKEDDDEDPEEDHIDYPADEGDDGDDEDESSEDDDEVDIEANNDDEEEEHPTLADFAVVTLPTAD
ncbi:hypothetical protein Tco_1183186 [Tanacetum coccineum]